MTETLKNTENQEQPCKDLSMTELDLKSIRESKKLTLNNIFERTRISMANLEAIEKGEYHLLPPPVFTRSFIRIYAKNLGIESNPIIARYEQYLETLKSSQKDAAEKEKSAEPEKVNYRAFLLGFFIFIVAGVVIFTLSSKKSDINILKSQISEPTQKDVGIKPSEVINSEVKSETDQNLVQTNQEKGAQLPTASEAQSGMPPVQKGGTTTITRKQKKTVGTSQLVMEAKELTWLRISTDEEPPYEVLLQPGETLERSGSNFIIDVGNAGGVDIEFQGKSLGNLGKSGQVVHLKLP